MSVAATAGIASPNSLRPRGFPFFLLPADDDEQTASKSTAIKPKAKVQHRPRTARHNLAASDIEPCWMKYADRSDDVAEASAAGPKKRGRPSKAATNSLKHRLSGFNVPGLALAGLPGLDHIVTGAVNLDLDGNTRPLSKKVVISMLQRLDVISTKAVQEYMHLTLRQCSERHAQKIAQCLRVIERAAASIAPSQWPGRSAPDIEPCGNATCQVCRQSRMHGPSSAIESNYDDFAAEPDSWSEADLTPPIESVIKPCVSEAVN